MSSVTTPKKDTAGRGCSAFNPLARHDTELFQSIMAGEHCLRGFTNRDIRSRLASTVHLRVTAAARSDKGSLAFSGIRI